MTDRAASIGYMQGRLSPIVDGKIQSFPWSDWHAEFPAAQRLGFGLMEWTLDYERLADNPLMTRQGRAEVRRLSSKYNIKIRSLTADFLMQMPFWKVTGVSRGQRLLELDLVLDACSFSGIRMVVVPLVDSGEILNGEQEEAVIEAFTARIDRLRRDDLVVAFECNYHPKSLALFIHQLPSDVCGINLDIGNSAALGYDIADEITLYGHRIVHVHVKDRILGGTTVPLGTGSADIPRALRLLLASGYRGLFILQPARAKDGDHEGALSRYLALTQRWLADAEQWT